MIIQTIQQHPSRAVWIDDPSDVSRPDPSGADQSDAEHQATDLAVGEFESLAARTALSSAGLPSPPPAFNNETSTDGYWIRTPAMPTLSRGWEREQSKGGRWDAAPVVPVKKLCAHRGSR